MTQPSNPGAASPRGAVLAAAIEMTKPLLARYLVGFNDVTHVRQTPDLPNHLCWCLGHCALTMHRVAGALDGKELPAKDFHKGDGTRGSRNDGYFDTEAVAFNSKPEERHDRFPTLARATEIYNAAADRLAGLLRAADDATLDTPVQFGTLTATPWELAIRMVFHNGFHTGQIADLRRALGFKSIYA
ncbi:hypothetical protein BH11PLA1_BH11PLA1_03550 [soil metagenome]